jgi:glyceraldehyde 3-phosphate dehydrogenase
VHDQLPRRRSAKVLHESFGIKKGLDDDLPLVHRTTSSCSTCRTRTCGARARRRSRFIPTTTGAARAVGEVLPELKGKLDGISHARADAERVGRRPRGARRQEDDRREVNAAFKAAADGR